MKNNNKKLCWFLFAALAVLYLLNYRLTTPTTTDNSNGWTVYGTKGCGWTRKQLDHMKDNNVPHKFIDCDKEKCEGMDGYPTLKDPNGKISVGFMQVQ